MQLTSKCTVFLNEIICNKPIILAHLSQSLIHVGELKDTLIVLLLKTTHPLSPLINSPDSIAHIKDLAYLSDYGVIRTCLGGAM